MIASLRRYYPDQVMRVSMYGNIPLSLGSPSTNYYLFICLPYHNQFYQVCQYNLVRFLCYYRFIIFLAFGSAISYNNDRQNERRIIL